MTAAVREFLIWLFIWMTPIGVVSLIVYSLLTLPQRRIEQARLLLDILQTGLDRGQSPERTILSVSDSRERSVGVRFHLLAARLDEGLTLGQAMLLTPGALPQSIAEIISLGSGQNNLHRLLPAARAILSESSSRLRGGLNYVILIFFVMGPAALVLLTGFMARIGPRIQQVFNDMFLETGTVPPPPMLSAWMFNHIWLVTVIQVALVALLIACAIAYIWGEGALRFGRKFFGSLPDRALLLLPWRRRRAQRDFTGLFAVLLDSGVRDAEALRLAARATANRLIIIRANTASKRLANGEPLAAALATMDVGAEFQWRWANALRAGKDFFAALRGWHEWLNAKAFQQEQAAAHLITSGFVLINGSIVLLIIVAVFQFIIAIVEQEALW